MKVSNAIRSVLITKVYGTLACRYGTHCPKTLAVHTYTNNLSRCAAVSYATRSCDKIISKQSYCAPPASGTELSRYETCYERYGMTHSRFGFRKATEKRCARYTCLYECCERGECLFEIYFYDFKKYETFLLL